MNNQMCNDWFMERKYQQDMSNADYAMMEEAQQDVVINKCEEDIFGEISKESDVTNGDDVTKARKEKNNQRIYPKNSWLSMIFMTLCFVFYFVAGNMVCLVAGQMKDQHKYFVKT